MCFNGNCATHLDDPGCLRYVSGGVVVSFAFGGDELKREESFDGCATTISRVLGR